MEKDNTKPLTNKRMVRALFYLLIMAITAWFIWKNLASYPNLSKLVAGLLFVSFLLLWYSAVMCFSALWFYVLRNIIGRTEYAYYDDSGGHYRMDDFPASSFPSPKWFLEYRVGGWFRHNRLYRRIFRGEHCFYNDDDYKIVHYWQVEGWDGETFSLRDSSGQKISGIRLKTLLELASRFQHVESVCVGLLQLAKQRRYLEEGIGGIIKQVLADKVTVGRSRHAKGIRVAMELLLKNIPEKNWKILDWVNSDQS
jgi:hypothetical protein